jgi:multiple sugar transport system substrate-binding protein
MAWSHSVGAVDEAFDAYARQWGADNDVAVTVDHIAINDIPTKLAAEIRSQAGHDLVQMPPATGVALYADQLVDVSSFVEELGAPHGGWNSLAQQGAFYDGAWLAYPDYGSAKPSLYRKDLFDQYGLAAPTTWEAVLAAGKELKPKGFPLGLTLSHTGDANQYWMALLWCYGAFWAKEDGTYVGTLDTPQMREALDMAKQIYTEGCTPDVLSWDDSGNNSAYIAGVNSYTINGISIVAATEEANPDVAAATALAVPPAGPVAQQMLTNQFMLGIWKFSEQQETALDFLTAYDQEWEQFAEVSGGFNLKLWNDIPRPYPVLDESERTKDLVDSVSMLASVGYPGPATAAAAQVATDYLIVDLVIDVAVNGTDAVDAIASTEEKIRKIYELNGLL